MASFNETKRKILDLISKLGEAKLEDLIRELGLSRGAILGHLTWLRKYGYISPVGIYTYTLVKSVTSVFKEEARRILASVPMEKAFYFYLDYGRFSGLIATNFAEFCNIIGAINIDSIEFHLKRGDFENWMKDVLRDDEMEFKIREIREMELKGEELRRALFEALKARYEELRKVAEL